MVQTQRVRTTQPQGPVRVDWSNPIARGIVFAAIPGNPEILSGTQGLPIGGGSLSTFDGGRSFHTTTENTDGWYWPVPANHPVYTITTQCTMLVIAKLVAGTSYKQLVGIPYAAGSWSPPFQALGLNTNSDASQGALNYAVSGQGRGGVFASAGWITPGKTVVYGGTRNGTVLKGYLGPTQYGSDGTGADAGAVDFTNKQPVVLFNHSNSSAGEGFVGDGSLVLFWNRALSPSEWSAVAINPWKVFASPGSHLSYYPLPSGNVSAVY